MIKNTYWLASYPKSGNTWFRLFLNQLLGPEQQLNLNDLPIKNTIASDRNCFDAGLGINSSDLLPNEIDYLRPSCDEVYNQALTEPMFRKIHDAYISPYSHRPIISTKITGGVIYIVRNPLDILVSYSHHLNKNINTTLKKLNGLSNLDKPIEEIKTQLEQHMGRWSHHVSSWTEQKDVPVHLVRYEDLLTKPFKHFRDAIKFAQIDIDDSAIKKAIENTSFDKLRQQEIDNRFVETPSTNRHFFRKGVAGGWRDDLTQQQADKIIVEHSVMMHTLGYLNDDNMPIY